MRITQEKLERLAKCIFLIEFAKLMNVTPMQLLEANKSAEITLIRNLYCLWRYTKHNLTYKEIGYEINRDRSTVSHGVRRTINLIQVKDDKAIAYWKMIKKMPCIVIQHPSSVEFFKRQGEVSEQRYCGSLTNNNCYSAELQRESCRVVYAEK